MKFVINETLLTAMEKGASALRDNVMHLRSELKKDDKKELAEHLEPVLEAQSQHADILEGFIKRVRWLKENQDRI